MAERERTVTGVPLWLLRAYLVDAGGAARDDHAVTGDGWHATLEQSDDHVIGSLRVGRVCVVVRGDDAAVTRVWSELAPRLLRAGG